MIIKLTDLWVEILFWLTPILSFTCIDKDVHFYSSMLLSRCLTYSEYCFWTLKYFTDQISSKFFEFECSNCPKYFLNSHVTAKLSLTENFVEKLPFLLGPSQIQWVIWLQIPMYRLLSAKTRENAGYTFQGPSISKNHPVYDYNHLKRFATRRIPDSKNCRRGTYPAILIT